MMKFRFQVAAVGLALAMLAPPVFATVACSQRTPEAADPCSPCCAGMDEMSMAMAGAAMQPANDAQLTQAPCCTVMQTEAPIPAPPAAGVRTLTTLLASAPLMALPANAQSVRRATAQSPPGPGQSGPVLSRLCTFLI